MIAFPIDALTLLSLALTPLRAEPCLTKGLGAASLGLTVGFKDATLFLWSVLGTTTISYFSVSTLVSSSTIYFLGAICGILEGGMLEFTLETLAYVEDLFAVPVGGMDPALAMLLLSIFFFRRLNLDCMVVPTGPTRVASVKLSVLIEGSKPEGRRFSLSLMMIYSGIS